MPDELTTSQIPVSEAPAVPQDPVPDSRPDPIKTAQEIKQDIEAGLTETQIREKTGKSGTTQRLYLKLIKLPPEVKDMIFQGKLSFDQARALFQIPENRPDLILEAANHIAQNTQSRREAEGYVMRQLAPPVGAEQNKVGATQNLEEAVGGNGDKAGATKNSLGAVGTESNKVGAPQNLLGAEVGAEPSKVGALGAKPDKVGADAEKWIKSPSAPTSQQNTPESRGGTTGRVPGTGSGGVPGTDGGWVKDAAGTFLKDEAMDLTWGLGSLGGFLRTCIEKGFSRLEGVSVKRKFTSLEKVLIGVLLISWFSGPAFSLLTWPVRAAIHHYWSSPLTLALSPGGERGTPGGLSALMSSVPVLQGTLFKWAHYTRAQR